MEKVTLLNDGQDADVHVSWEDQQKINRFSQLNLLLGGCELQLEELAAEIEAMEDANTELELNCMDDLDDLLDLEDELLDEDDELADEEKTGDGKKKKEGGSRATIPYRLGDVFVMFTPDEAKAMLHSDLNELKTIQKQRKDEVESMQNEMKALKKGLYARFGNSIQLERD